MLRSITGQRLHQNQILELPLRVSTHQVMPTVAVFYFHSVVCLQTNPGAIPPGYSHELRCQVGVFIVQVQQHHSAPSLPTLAESSRTDSVQARPFWLTCRNGTAPTYLVDELLQFAYFGIRSHLVTYDQRRCHHWLSTVGTRLSNFSDRRCSYLQRCAAPSHTSAPSPPFPVTACLKTHLFRLLVRPISSGVHSFDYD